MTKKDAKELLLKYHSGTASDEEKAFVENWMLHAAAGDLDLSDEEIVHDLAEIRQRLGIDLPQKKIVRLWPRIAAAASILLFLSVGGYYLLHKSANSTRTAHHSPNDIAPGGNKAILTLANGQKISLTDAKNGTIAKENQVAINKTANGQLVYAAPASTATTTATATFNSIQTPRGGQYHLTLADGTQVWLNAASSLKYPSAFNGKERKVELTGEAYFEVVHNSAKPFRVIAANQTVEDIGTHFNINAYADEPAINTTLLEGSVKVSQLITHNSKILKPGQQSVIQPENTSILVRSVNPKGAIAWKNGFFMFEGESIQSIMRRITRWYDVDVAYQGKVTTEQYSGYISRFQNVSEVLRMLEKTNTVKFKVEGRRITVTE